MKIIKKLSFLCLLPVILLAQTSLLNPYTLSDITGTGATVALASVYTPAKVIKLTAPSTNSANIRYGDASTTSTHGDILVAGSKDSISAINGGYIDLHVISAYIANGDKLVVTYWYGN